MEGVFVALVDGQLHALVSPQALECLEAVQRHGVFWPDFGIGSDNLGVALDKSVYLSGVRWWAAHLVGGVGELDLLLLHGAKDDLEGMHEVLEDCDLPLLALGVGEALGVDEAHLLEDGGLARLASA